MPKTKMKFKELTEKQKLKLKEIYLSKEISWNEKEQALGKYTGVDPRTARKWCEKLGYTKPSEPESPQYEEAKKKKFDKSRKRFIITWAQNDTPVHEVFLRNIEAYGKHIDADIHVMAGRYKNPTSVFTDVAHDTWHSRVLPYLDANRHDIHKYLSIMSDIKLQPTAVNPMTGLQGVSEENSCIFGHPKIQLETVPVLEGQKPKMMVTTGACTMPNYTDSKAGKKGEFHHQLGFVVVEIKDKEIFFIRQVSATDDGNFTDLYFKTQFKGTYKMNKKGEYNDVEGEGKVSLIKKVEACILGDLHYGHHDPVVLDKTHDLLGLIKPNHVVLHDIFDGYSISHHEMKNPFAQIAKEAKGLNDLGREVDQLMEGLERFKKYKKVVVVRSNHDDFIDRWLINGDWKKQPTYKNSDLYFEYALRLSRQYKSGNVIGIIPELVLEKFPKFVTLDGRNSYKVKGWELGYHGDKGTNGSRGSLLQFRKLNTKCVVGHYHSPGRKDGAIAVGTTTHLRVGYNEGPSSWLQSHVLIHEDGKAQHINFIEGEYTTFKFAA
jgi:hypothetical protein